MQARSFVSASDWSVLTFVPVFVRPLPDRRELIGYHFSPHACELIQPTSSEVAELLESLAVRLQVIHERLIVGLVEMVDRHSLRQKSSI